MSRQVILRDVSSGRLHIGTLVNGQVQRFEADNADDAGEAVVVGSDVLANAEPDQLCRRCFPDNPVDPEDAA